MILSKSKTCHSKLIGVYVGRCSTHVKLPEITNGKLFEMEARHVENYIQILNVSAANRCVWGALLNSCKARGDVKPPKITTEKLFQMEPRHAENYI